MPHTPRIPDLPGELLAPEHARGLRDLVAQLCHLNNPKFPGSQPVSFSQKDLDRLEQEDYWVCEKSDGVRVLLFIHTIDEETQLSYLIDRHNNYRLLKGFFFTHHENPRRPLRSSILDGELVLDMDPITRQETLRLLVFDCLVVDDQNVMSRTLDKRYGRLTEWFYKPYKKMIQDHPYMLQEQPFEIKVKPMELSYGLEKVFNEIIPRLQHGNDGLIYTCLQSPYTVGTDKKILKWKPPSENTIDFKLVLRFPPRPDSSGEPDFCAKPKFWLQVHVGGREGYEPYDELYVEDEEWGSLKSSGEQVDDRIVEVFWEKPGRWRMMRFRDDKPNGNHKSVVENIIESIMDGVEKEDLLARSQFIRSAWKARQSRGASSQGQAHAQGAPARAQPRYEMPKVDLRYGPLQESPHSRVAGPLVYLGFYR